MIETSLAVIFTAAFAGTVETSLAVVAVATFTGAVSGALTAWLYLRRNRHASPKAQPVPLPDPALDGEIQRAAAAWADDNGRPEATGLMADKLHLLHHIGRRRGWWSR